MRRRELLGLAAALGSGVAAWPALPAAAETRPQILLKAVDARPADYPTVRAVAAMGKKLSSATGGRIGIEMLTGAQAGDEDSLVSRVQAGTIQFARVGVSAVAPLVDEFNVFNLPFLFRNTAHMEAVIDGSIGQSLLDKVAADPQTQLVGLCWMDAGARNIYDSKRPIRTIDDVRGLRIRVVRNQMAIEMIDDLGGIGVAMKYAKVLKALERGVIDGAENNPPSYMLSGHYQVAKYYSLTEHLIVPEVLVFSRPVWDALAPDDQAVLKKLAREAQREERQMWVETEDAAMAKMKAAGIEIIPVTDKAPFRQAVKPVWDRYGARYRELVRQIEEVG